MKIRNDYTCPLEIVHDIIKGKWKTIIIFQMRSASVSLSDLEKSITGISQKMLLQQLNELRQFGLVDKENAPGYPLHVDYYLTERGQRILKAIEIMQEVGIDYMVEHQLTDILDQKGICYRK
ncbi:helix-turn-helix domain-containing protein [Acetobacterium sp.]|jgi:DNA-binding HxlR family transcriptional regulator|uniref:winged helix-turn-helix transcriptional regulator n=1 Tax=Acetobacterium sp. TaxID=1872094 RepID=UPI000CC7383E|nr:helix-turn-helix domain-containing protein [Acetobacterium sp.]MDO9492202.1 helix-turn-helix domain-containing protein [Acetobacterium sp.]PKM74757.1 MAG: transcriptional regulator [Firmicutes bacterium HGW-Firmicutes-17]